MTIYVKRTVDRPLAGDTIPQHLQGILVLSFISETLFETRQRRKVKSV